MKRPLTIIAALLGSLALYLVVDRGAPRDGAVTAPQGNSTLPESQAADGSSREPPPPSPIPEVNPSRLALAVEGEGLRLFDVETGSARPIPFGTAGDATREMVAASGDGQVVEDGESVECDIQFARLENGLTIWFRGNSFVGWSLRDPEGSLTTVGGIGIGSTRTDLESVYDARIFQSSLGVEFAAGALAGLLESDGPGGKVSNLWAGETCIAR